MSDFPEGSLKYDPETGAVAVRTNQPLEPPSAFIPSAAWCVATTNSGAHLVGAAAVADWLDIAIPVA